MVIVDMAARIRGSQCRVFTLDTGRLPEETYRMIETVRERYGITVETVAPEMQELEAMVREHGPNLFHQSVELRRMCCEIRKVRPLQRKLRELQAWATGLRRQQSETRAAVRKAEEIEGVVRVSPLADWDTSQVAAYVREHNVPEHPLYQRGYTSIGCGPCTRAVAPGEDERAGRWWWGKWDRQGMWHSLLPQRGGGTECIRDSLSGSPGMSGAGKSTLSQLLAERLRAQGAKVELLDGDEVREHLSKGLGFSKEDRDINIRRIGFVCELLSRHGVIAIAAAISPYRAVRDEVRARIPGFVEVYVECPLEELARRDVKGLYRKALAGEIGQFTGISDPYEPPVAPEITLRSSEETPQESVDRIWATLERLGLISFGSISTRTPTNLTGLVRPCNWSKRLFARACTSWASPTTTRSPGTIRQRLSPPRAGLDLVLRHRTLHQTARALGTPAGLLPGLRRSGGLSGVGAGHAGVAAGPAISGWWRGCGIWASRSRWRKRNRAAVA